MPDAIIPEKILEIVEFLLTSSYRKNLRILVTGQKGHGKSSLVNGILGMDINKEKVCATKYVTKLKKNKNGVQVTVLESHSQDCIGADEDEYVQGIRNTCKKLSLVLYCKKMTNTRLTDDDRNDMIKLTRAFGEDFWNYTVFVLTFANKEDVSKKDERDDDDESEPDDDEEEAWKELEKRRFQGRLKIWAEDLQNFLIREVKVSPEVARNIPVIPTGDHKKSRNNKYPMCLPDREDWFIKFWEACCLQVRVEHKYLFLKINCDRTVPEADEDSNEKQV